MIKTILHQNNIAYANIIPLNCNGLVTI